MSMTPSRCLTPLLAVAAVLAAGSAPTSAQVNAESFARLGFNFSPPGARSAALGGAFIPLADDATAAETNPAGLTVLLYPQASFEFKGIEYVRTLTEEAGGGTDGTDFTDQIGFPSFASVVVPLGPVTVAAFRHELVNYHNTVYSAGLQRTALLPFTSELEIGVANYGGAVAVGLGPSFSLGVAGGISQFNMYVDFPRYRVARFEDDWIENELFVDAGQSGVFVNAGLLLRLGERASIGAVYKLRPEFSDVPFELYDGTGDLIREESGIVKIPDAVGGGIALRPTELLTITADAVLTMYSQIPAEQVIIYNPTTDDPSNYAADDGLDIHAGIEYIVFLGQTPLSLRAGVAQTAASNVYYTGTSQVEQGLWGTEPAEADLQFTAGIGLVLARRFQLEAAGAVGANRGELVASLVYFFGSV